MPDRRQVYDAMWNSRPVIVKVFSGLFNAKRHACREWRGLQTLAARGVNSPLPLFYGPTGQGQWAVVTEKIVNSSTALDVFNSLNDKTTRHRLLEQLIGELASQHQKGVMQKDLHLGNILVKNGSFFALDPAQMRFFRGPLPRTESLRQLATLLCNIDDDETEAVKRLCGVYENARQWKLTESDYLSLQKYSDSQRKQGIRNALKKSLRTTRRYLRVDTGRHRAVFDRTLCGETEFADFLQKIDGLMDAGKILKNGNTCYVSRINWNGRDIVVKRYNHKGFFHSLRHTLKGSRAKLCWLHGHRLRMLNISTPKPLAYIEERKGFIVWKSYLLTEYVDGRSFRDFLRDKSISDDERRDITARVQKLLDKMAENLITHADLKHSNILISSGKPVLIDLDSVTVHVCKWTCDLCNSRYSKQFAFDETKPNTA